MVHTDKTHQIRSRVWQETNKVEVIHVLHVGARIVGVFRRTGFARRRIAFDSSRFARAIFHNAYQHVGKRRDGIGVVDDLLAIPRDLLLPKRASR